MPRKKLGLRSYHHKSRNGCLQCKRRRVKCGMQEPKCANCLRRNESCEYPPPVDEKSVTPEPMSWGLEYVDTDSWGLTTDSGDSFITGGSAQPSQPPPFLPDLISNPTESDEATCEKTRELLDSLLKNGGSWFSNPEIELWTTAVAKSAPKFPYLQHCIQALAHMKHHNENGYRWPSTHAYHHQLQASKMFREATPSVDETNWLPVLAFAIIMLIFQFASQNQCDEAHFNIIETLHALRSTMRIEDSARYYFRQTHVWGLILERTSVPRPGPDLKLRTSFYSLSLIVLSPFQDVKIGGHITEAMECNRQAFYELEKWAMACEGYPKRWDEYQEWPSKLSTHFLDFLASGDDVSLLIFIHWAAVMTRSVKPFVRLWAIRAGMSEVRRLEGRWSEQLVWPLELLAPEAAEETKRSTQLSLMHPMGEIGPGQDLALHPDISSFIDPALALAVTSADFAGTLICPTTRDEQPMLTSYSPYSSPYTSPYSSPT